MSFTQLRVSGNSVLSNTLSVAGATNALSTLGVTGTLNALSALGVTGDATFSANVNVDSGTLFVDGVNNRVGIGTTSPAYNLEVNGNRPIFLNTGGGGGAVAIKGDTGGWATGFYFFGSSGTNRGGYGALGTADNLTNFWIGPAFNNTWMVLNNGNVGIGNTAPAHLLRVDGTTSLNGAVNALSTLAVTGATTLSSTLGVTGVATFSANANFDSGTLFVDSVNNRVGINNTAPTTALEVTGTVTATTFSGSGASLTALNASALSTGTVPVGRLDSSVILTTSTTGINASALSVGTVPVARLDSSVLLTTSTTGINASALSTGTVPVGRLDSSVLLTTSTTGINASALSTGTVPTARLTSASASANGVVDTTTQTFAGNKTFNNDVTIAGTLTLLGQGLTLNTNNIIVQDSLIQLAANNTTSDALDIGLYGNYNGDGGAHEHTGLFRDASDGLWKLFVGLQDAPTNTTINIAGTGYAVGTLQTYLTSGGMVSNSTAFAVTANSSYTGTLTVNSVTAQTLTGNLTGTASNATNLNSQPGSFYTNASNLNTGTVPIARLDANVILTTSTTDINASALSTGTVPLARLTSANSSANGVVDTNTQTFAGLKTFSGNATFSGSRTFFANGSVLDWNSGDVTVTHAVDTLTFAGASTGYVFNDGPVTLAAGAVGTPSLTTNGDLNTGLYFPAADTIAVTTAGSERLRITSGGDVAVAATAKLYLDGVAGTGDTYFTQSVNNRISMVVGGTERLRVDGDSDVVGTRVSILGTSLDAYQFRITNLNSIQAALQYFNNGSGNFFIGNDSSGGGALSGTAYARAIWGQGAYPMVFATNNVERLRMTSGGDIAIGATAKLYVDGVAATGDTYISESSANKLSFFAGGTESLSLNASAANVSTTLGVTGTLSALGQLSVTGNATFDTNTLFVDAVNDRVGIGTNSPVGQLDVASAAPVLTIRNTSAALLAGTTVGSLNYYTDDTSNLPNRVVASISALAEVNYVGIDNASTSLVFSTHPNVERFRLNSSGVAILGSGEASATPVGNTLRAPSGTGTDITGGTLTITAGNGTGTGGSGAIVFQTAAAGLTGTAGNSMVDRLRITSGGNIGLGATAKLFLDGAAATGDTYISESSANKLSFFAGGTESLSLNASAANVSTTLGVTGTLTALGQLVVGANANFDSGTLFVDGVNNRVGVNNTAPTTALEVTGTVTATTFSGSGASLTALNASALSTGTVPLARLSSANSSANGVVDTTTQTFAGVKTFQNAATFSSTLGVTGVATFSANANFDSGTLFVDGVNNRVGVNNSAPTTALEVTGTVTATTFSGSGASLTSLNASTLSTGTVPVGRLDSSVLLTTSTTGINASALSVGTVPVARLDSSVILTTSTTGINASALSVGTVPVARLDSSVLLTTSTTGINASAISTGSLSYARLATTTAGNLLMGNSSGGVQGLAMTGDVTITSAGVTAIGSGKVTSAMIVDGTIVDGDINASAAIAYSKLSLANSIVNADISSSAAIAVSKLAASTISGITLGNNLNAATFNNAGAGAASGSTYNGSSALTVSYNTVGAPSTGGTGATGTWGISISGTASNATNLNSQPASFYTNASNITTGTLPVAQLNANVILTTSTTGINASALSVGTVPVARLDSSVLLTTSTTGINASALSVGTVPVARLDSSVILTTSTTGINASALSTGTVPVARLSSANTSAAGVVDTTTQTFAGNKTFQNTVILQSALTANSGNGSAGQVLTSNGAGVYWANASAGAAANTAGGTGALQFYNGTTLGADANLAFLTNTLTVNGGMTVAANANFDSGTLFVDGVNNRVGINNTAPTTALQVTGTVTATTFSGSGASLTALNASALSTGTVPVARLDSSVILTTSTTGINASALSVGTVPVGRLDSSVLLTTSTTGINASALSTGTVPVARLDSSVILTTSTTGINASALSVGTVPVARLSSANTTAAGVVDTTTQTFAGNKTFQNAATFSNTVSISGAANALSTLGVTGTLTALGQLVVTTNAAFDTNVLFVDAVNNRVGVNNSGPTTALEVTGTVTATTFAGSGASLTSLNATALSSGTVPVARLDSSVLLTTSTTGINASALSTGTVPLARLSSASASANGVVNTTTQTFAGNKTFSGTVNATSTLGVTGTLTALGQLVVTTNAAFDTNVLFVDAVNNRVGVNNAAPSQAFRVDGTTSLNGNVAIGTTNTSAFALLVEGSFAATTKEFNIAHPTRPGKRLRYGVLESPYHGVRLTGRAELTGTEVEVPLPEYLGALCTDIGSQVQLTNHGHDKVLWVDRIDLTRNCFVVRMRRRWWDRTPYAFYWAFTGIRQDVEPLDVEPE